MKPHWSFSYIRADEVAECWEGVTDALYSALWNKVVPHQKPIPNLEDNGPADVVGWANLASHWDKLDEHEQLELNKLAGARARWRAVRSATMTEDKAREIYQATDLSPYSTEELRNADAFVQGWATAKLRQVIKELHPPLQEYIMLMVRTHYGAVETDNLLRDLDCYPWWAAWGYEANKT